MRPITERNSSSFSLSNGLRGDRRPGRYARARVGGRAGEAALARGTARAGGAYPSPSSRSGAAPLRVVACQSIMRERGRAREREKEGDSILPEINTEEIVTHIHHIPQTQCDISGMLQRRQHIPAALQVAEIG